MGRRLVVNNTVLRVVHRNFVDSSIIDKWLSIIPVYLAHEVVCLKLR